MLYDLLVAPFADFAFMRRALIACLALSLGCAPVGMFLLLRRMSLLGDALSHSVLPGAAIGFLLGGLSLPAMGLGGFVAGLTVALLSGLATRFTALREDANFAAFYLISLASGVMIVSAHGSNVDLMHVLFGSVLAVDDLSLLLVASIASVTLCGFALLYRPLVAECFDPGFLRAVGGGGGWVHLAFLVLVVLNLVAGFQALGTLMAVGLMMLPAAAARMWVRRLWALVAVAALIAFASGYAGLVLSFRFDLPSGPAIVLVAGAVYLLSLLLGRVEGVLPRMIRRPHFEA
ncbi:metal ABC transporter permease [Magnetospirillum fulvum]|uniref:Zinc/manganese transport system permease protein n=1 Tax=Magnetospirillum fulvum TaxID=1082 RepID=A0A1H6HET7_MAGFU|nr:metal ABC transporter permease [Magnetospirillum fulvum]SEH34357.1 zinc/manganese transport system permease protein [Magnetospirillum fulvum]